MTQPPEREIGQELVGAMHHSTGSYELVVAAIAAGAVGFFIDRLVGTMPIFTLIFSIAGFIGAGYSIYLQYSAKMADQHATQMARRSAPTTTPTTTPASTAEGAA